MFIRFSCLEKVQIKVQTDNPPNGLSLSIQLPLKLTTPQTTIHMQITILPDVAQPYVAVFGDISKFNLNDPEYNRVLQAHQDIPMLINCLLNNLLKLPNVNEIQLEENKMMIDEFNTDFVSTKNFL